MTKPVLHPELCERIGFGCGRLVGGTSFKESALLLEAAAELGIRYFDTAPSYGLGSADRVLGEVLGGDPQFEIATKVGISRPKNATLLSTARLFVAPVVRQVAPLKKLALGYLSRQVKRQEMDGNMLLESFEESLNLLKRDSVDVLFLHEAIGVCNGQTQKFFEQMLSVQKIRYFGVALSASKIDTKFGNAIQLGYCDNFELPNSGQRVSIHGALKNPISTEQKLIFNLKNSLSLSSFSSCSEKEIEASIRLYKAITLDGISKVIVSFRSVDSMIKVFSIVSYLLKVKL